MYIVLAVVFMVVASQAVANPLTAPGGGILNNPHLGENSAVQGAFSMQGIFNMQRNTEDIVSSASNNIVEANKSIRGVTISSIAISNAAINSIKGLLYGP